MVEGQLQAILENRTGSVKLTGTEKQSKVMSEITNSEW